MYLQLNNWIYPEFINLQKQFRKDWSEIHSHPPSKLWSLQDTVASLLNEWLDKPNTLEKFEANNRQALIDYATKDCLSMQRIILQLKLIKKHFVRPNEPRLNYQLEDISSNLVPLNKEDNIIGTK